MADQDPLKQNEIEQLLASAGAAPPGKEGEQRGASPNPAANQGLDQSEIDALTRSDAGQEPAAQPTQTAQTTQAQTAAPGEPPGQAGESSGPVRPEASVPGGSAPAQVEGGIAPGDVEFLLNQAQKAIESIDAESQAPPGVSAFRLEEFSGAPASTENATLDLIRDVELDLKIELGRTHMYLEDVLKLRRGSVVPLDKLAGDPVDIYVNGRLIARGEVLVLNDNFCVRVAELLAGVRAEP